MMKHQMELQKKNEKIVSLYSAEGVNLIFLSNSGVIYTNQTGGHACCQPAVEGILVPFNNDFFKDDDENLEKQLSSITLNAQFLDDKTADCIDQVLAKYYQTRCARVNRKKLKESMEAWIYVKIAEDKESDFYNFKAGEGILTWHNSD